MTFWSDLKNFVKDLIEEPNPKEPSIKWGTVQNRFEQILSMLRPPTERKNIKPVIQLLTEVLPSLETKRFQYRRGEEFTVLRATLLELWHHLLKCCNVYLSFLRSNSEQEKNEKLLRQQATVNADTDEFIPSPLPPEPQKPKQAPPFTWNEITIIQRTITSLICRKEFDLNVLNLDRDGNPHCAPEDLQAANRYRVLLFHTQEHMQNLLNFIVESSDFYNRPVFDFLGKGFAVTCFRLPKVLSLIVSAVGLTQEQQTEIEPHLSDKKTFVRSRDDDRFFSPTREPTPQGPVSTYYITSDSEEIAPDLIVDLNAIDPTEDTENPDMYNIGGAHESQESFPPLAPSFEDRTPQERVVLMAETFPNLFQWPQYHCAMLNYKLDNEDDKLKAGPWLEEFRKKDTLFYIFLDYWVKHVKWVTGEQFNQIDWPTIKGYRMFIPAFIYAFKRYSLDMPRDLLECSSTLLITDPNLLTFFIVHVFSQTNVYNISDTTSSLHLAENWFKQLSDNNLVLTERFDIKFFSKAVEMIFHTDHHQLMTRVLGMLYVAMDCFVGEARKTLIIDVLLHKYFFRLFLHWDSVVRNCYQQLLLFKAMRIKRAEITSNRVFPDTFVSGPGGQINMETINDTVIYSKIESYIRMLEDQLRHDLKRQHQDFPKELEVYSSRALEEYRAYTKLYLHWERSGARKAPKLIPYGLLPADFRPKPK